MFKMTLVFTIISGQKSLGSCRLPDTSSELKADNCSEFWHFSPNIQYNPPKTQCWMESAAMLPWPFKQSILSKQLQESEEKYHGLFENSRDALMTLEPPSWKFTSCNSATLKLFNVETKEKFLIARPMGRFAFATARRSCFCG